MTFPALQFFDKAKKAIIAEGYGQEIEYVQNRYFKDITVETFKVEATFVILASSGLKEQIVRKNFDAFMGGMDPTSARWVLDPYPLIPNGRQRAAIRNIWKNGEEILQQIRDRPTDAEKIEFLDSLPQIGKITKFHFARNLGIDCIKPDLWMDRLAEIYDFSDPFAMCEAIRKERPENRIGTVDVILWRYCNLFGLVGV
jgi:hypothetical protein